MSEETEKKKANGPADKDHGEARSSAMDNVSWGFTQLDPALSEQRWSQFTKTSSPATTPGRPPPGLSAEGHSSPPPPSVDSTHGNGSDVTNAPEPTILCPVGTSANGAPLFMALTPQQLAATGGNPQLLLRGASFDSSKTGQHPSPQQSPPQHIPQFTLPSGSSTPNAGGNAPFTMPPPSPSAPGKGVQMVIPPGMSIPVPVPISTLQVKSQVGVPTTPNYSSPMPGGMNTPGGNRFNHPMRTPTGATPVLLQMPQGMPPQGIYNGGPVASTPPKGSRGGGDIAGEQRVWAANEHLFSDRAPTIGDVKSLGGSSRSNDTTPQAQSAKRSIPSPQATRSSSGGPTPQGEETKKPTKQEMLLQQLQASHPSSTLPPPTAVDPSEDPEERWKRRAELEERLVGRKEDSTTPMASGGPLSASSTPVAAWKAKPCRQFKETGTCKYGDKCVFAHGSEQ